MQMPWTTEILSRMLARGHLESIMPVLSMDGIINT